MHARTLPSFVCLLLAAAAGAQAPPKPAPELQKLAPYVGTWSGSGTMTEPGGKVTKWTGSGTCAWCLDGHFLQEDWQIAFEGMPAPKVMHTRLGWDRAHQRYVSAYVGNDGEVSLDEFQILPDGARLETMVKQQDGASYALRSRFRLVGDTLVHTVDLLMPEGNSTQIVDGTFTRGGKAFAGGFDCATWMGVVSHASIARLGKAAGTYASSGSVCAVPGQPPVPFRGTETFRRVFGDTVVYGRSEGAADGAAAQYVGEVFWGHDARRDGLVGVYVSNMGDVMQMEARWSADGKLVTTSAPRFGEQLAVQRMVMEFDAAAAPKQAVGHWIVGTNAPEECFRAAYTKKP